MTAELDVATEIASRVRVTPGAGEIAGPVDLVLGTNVFTGPVRQAADPTNRSLANSVGAEAVFCLGTGGFDDDTFIIGDDPLRDPSDWPTIERPTVQVTVRSPPRNYGRGKSLADAVFKAVDKNPPSGYLGSRCPNSAPLYVREDEQSRHIWTINVFLWRCTGTIS